MDKAAAEAKIKGIFGTYTSLVGSWKADGLTDGKLYELYVLSRVIEDLASRGFRLRFIGSSLKFKAAPGYVHQTDPHFDVFSPGSTSPDFQLFTDIEIETLGSAQLSHKDDGCHHELDIAVIDAGIAGGRPTHEQVALGVECKAVAGFGKNLVREALGLRRELSLLAGEAPSRLAQALRRLHPLVPAEPPSELWVAFIDPKGMNYWRSPAVFGVDLRHWPPT
ncbi:hypothetical protein [Brevundimonas viscosa]|uniref:Uncharacterized protein n=1 Tax=Brevundimonas viscosa TaxID=871741 RepID=A0A1I6T7B9_9CAUL|nr:hypothetical protein [Brevundimonas viscosa]SFS85141.1 hypothetical protein SAMN05192570_3035 [Brevundimonas viscosa]